MVSSSKMINVSKYLLYLQEEQALIYRNCKYCLQSNGVENHLQRKHSTIPLKVCKKLMNYVESLILRNPSEVVVLIIIVLIFDCLKVTQGFRCSIYNYLYETLGSIKKHCEVH